MNKVDEFRQWKAGIAADDWLTKFTVSPGYKEQEKRQWFLNRFRRYANAHDWYIPLKTRVAVLERAQEHCEFCGVFGQEGRYCFFDLHHLTYLRRPNRKSMGTEIPEDLVALCRNCHKWIHEHCRGGVRRDESGVFYELTATQFIESFKSKREEGIRHHIEKLLEDYGLLKCIVGWGHRYDFTHRKLAVNLSEERLKC